MFSNFQKYENTESSTPQLGITFIIFSQNYCSIGSIECLIVSLFCLIPFASALWIIITKISKWKSLIPSAIQFLKSTQIPTSEHLLCPFTLGTKVILLLINGLQAALLAIFITVILPEGWIIQSIFGVSYFIGNWIIALAVGFDALGESQTQRITLISEQMCFISNAVVSLVLIVSSKNALDFSMVLCYIFNILISSISLIFLILNPSDLLNINNLKLTYYLSNPLKSVSTEKRSYQREFRFNSANKITAVTTESQNDDKEAEQNKQQFCNVNQYSLGQDTGLEINHPEIGDGDGDDGDSDSIFSEKNKEYIRDHTRTTDNQLPEIITPTAERRSERENKQSEGINYIDQPNTPSFTSKQFISYYYLNQISYDVLNRSTYSQYNLRISNMETPQFNEQFQNEESNKLNNQEIVSSRTVSSCFSQKQTKEKTSRKSSIVGSNNQINTGKVNSSGSNNSKQINQDEIHGISSNLDVNHENHFKTYYLDLKVDSFELAQRFHKKTVLYCISYTSKIGEKISIKRSFREFRDLSKCLIAECKSIIFPQLPQKLNKQHLTSQDLHERQKKFDHFLRFVVNQIDFQIPVLDNFLSKEIDIFSSSPARNPNKLVIIPQDKETIR